MPRRGMRILERADAGVRWRAPFLITQLRLWIGSEAGPYQISLKRLEVNGNDVGPGLLRVPM